MRPYLLMRDSGFGEINPSIYMVGTHRAEKIGTWPIASGSNGYGANSTGQNPLYRNKVIRFQNSIYTIQSGVVWRYGQDGENWTPVYSLKSFPGTQNQMNAQAKATTGMYYFIKDNHPCLTFFYNCSDQSTVRGVVYDGITNEWMETDKVDINVTSDGDAHTFEAFMSNVIYAPIVEGAGSVGGYIWSPISSGFTSIIEHENFIGNAAPFQCAAWCPYKQRYTLIGGHSNGDNFIYLMQGMSRTFTNLRSNIYVGQGQTSTGKWSMFTLDNEYVFYFHQADTDRHFEGCSWSANDTDGFVVQTGAYVFPTWNSPRMSVPWEMAHTRLNSDSSRIHTIFDRHMLDNPTDVRAYMQFSPFSPFQQGQGSCWFEWTPTLQSGYFRRVGTAASMAIDASMAIPYDNYGDGSRKYNGNLAYIQIEASNEGSSENSSKLHFRIYESAEFPSGTPCEAFILWGRGSNVPTNLCTISSTNKGSIRNNQYITGITFGSGELYTVEWNGIVDGVQPWDEITFIPAVSGVVA